MKRLLAVFTPTTPKAPDLPIPHLFGTPLAALAKLNEDERLRIANGGSGGKGNPGNAESDAADPDTDVPFEIQQFVTWLGREQACTVEGIFRIPGEGKRVKELRDHLDRLGPIDFTVCDDADVPAVAALFKQLLRDMPDGVIPEISFSDFAEAAGAYCWLFVEYDHSLFPLALSQLPSVNFSTLRYILRFLVLVHRQRRLNLMGSANLAMVFAPNIFRFPSARPSEGTSGAPTKTGGDATVVTEHRRGHSRSNSVFSGWHRPRRESGPPAPLSAVEMTGSGDLLDPTSHAALQMRETDLATRALTAMIDKFDDLFPGARPVGQEYTPALPPSATLQISKKLSASSVSPSTTPSQSPSHSGSTSRSSSSYPSPHSTRRVTAPSTAELPLLKPPPELSHHRTSSSSSAASSVSASRSEEVSSVMDPGSLEDATNGSSEETDKAEDSDTDERNDTRAGNRPKAITTASAPPHPPHSTKSTSPSEVDRDLVSLQPSRTRASHNSTVVSPVSLQHHPSPAQNELNHLKRGTTALRDTDTDTDPKTLPPSTDPLSPNSPSSAQTIVASSPTRGTVPNILRPSLRVSATSAPTTPQPQSGAKKVQFDKPQIFEFSEMSEASSVETQHGLGVELPHPDTTTENAKQPVTPTTTRTDPNLPQIHSETMQANESPSSNNANDGSSQTRSRRKDLPIPPRLTIPVPAATDTSRKLFSAPVPSQAMAPSPNTTFSNTVKKPPTRPPPPPPVKKQHGLSSPVRPMFAPMQSRPASGITLQKLSDPSPITTSTTSRPATPYVSPGATVVRAADTAIEDDTETTQGTTTGTSTTDSSYAYSDSDGEGEELMESRNGGFGGSIGNLSKLMSKPVENGRTKSLRVPVQAEEKLPRLQSPISCVPPSATNIGPNSSVTARLLKQLKQLQEHIKSVRTMYGGASYEEDLAYCIQVFKRLKSYLKSRKSSQPTSPCRKAFQRLERSRDLAGRPPDLERMTSIQLTDEATALKEELQMVKMWIKSSREQGMKVTAEDLGGIRTLLDRFALVQERLRENRGQIPPAVVDVTVEECRAEKKRLKLKILSVKAQGGVPNIEDLRRYHHLRAQLKAAN
ncbi:Rho GTPase-activating protein 25 [Gonapodya sp. JEL0774]|nr:Rho GTPase-activating protein 25 [Gonapodya sp. JEL0774]